jgi:hypothetical protein
MTAAETPAEIPKAELRLDLPDFDVRVTITTGEPAFVVHSTSPQRDDFSLFVDGLSLEAIESRFDRLRSVLTAARAAAMVGARTGEEREG